MTLLDHWLFQERTGDEEQMTHYKKASTMMTTGEVARLFGVHANAVRQWSNQGIIKAYRIGPRGDRRFRREDVAVLYLERAIRRHLKG